MKITTSEKQITLLTSWVCPKSDQIWNFLSMFGKYRLPPSFLTSNPFKTRQSASAMSLLYVQNCQTSFTCRPIAVDSQLVPSFRILLGSTLPPYFLFGNIVRATKSSSRISVRCQSSRKIYFFPFLGLQKVQIRKWAEYWYFIMFRSTVKSTNFPFIPPKPQR